MLTITAEVRKEYGKRASRRLRIIDKLPAIIYGGKTAPILIVLDHKKIWNMQEQPIFYNNILVIIISNDEEKVRVQAVQRHVFKPQLIHIDFIRA